MKSLGIIIENDDIDSDLDSLAFFVNEIYRKCKEEGITPTVVTAWITDLIDFSSENYQYLYENSKNDMKMLSKGNQTGGKRTLTFVSVISDFIEKKKELGDLSKKGKKISEEINQYELQKRELIEKMERLEQERQSFIVYYNRFMKLSNTLMKDCNIDLKKDLEPITKLFSDFKENGYDVTIIVEEYNKAVKLKWEIAQNEAQIRWYQKQLTSLQNDISAHQSRLDMHKKNWDIYQQLDKMKFEIEELNQLWLTVSEIARNIGDPFKDFDMIENPVAYFIKDVEDNYYDKLKFEDIVDKKRDELIMINVQLNNSRQNLLLQPFIGSVLLSLHQAGISEQDIIEINQVVRDNLLDKNLSIISLESEKENDNVNPTEKKKGGKVLIEELKNMVALKLRLRCNPNI